MDNMNKPFVNLTGGEDDVDSSKVQAEIGDMGLSDLNDVTFPITKAELLETLKNNGSSELLIEAVGKVPHDTFNDLNDLRSKLPI